MPTEAVAAPPAEAASEVAASPEQGAPLNDAFSMIDRMIETGEGRMDEPGDKKAPPPAKDKKAAPAKETPEQPEETPEQPADAKDKQQQPQDKPKPEKAASLRENYDRVKKELAEVKAKHEAVLKEKAQPKDDPEKKQLSERLTAAEKRTKELEEKLRYADFTETDDYKNNYWKPYEQSYIDGRATTAGLKTLEIKNDMGEVVQPSRQATARDFDIIMSKDDEEAAEHIEKLFGNGAKAGLVLSARRDAQKALAAADRAKMEYKTKGAERHKLASEQTSAQQKQIAEDFRNAIKSGVEKYPKLFKPIEGDDKGNAMLQEGSMVADLAFGVIDPADMGKLPQWIQSRLVDGQLPPQEMVNLHSAIRNMAADYNRRAFKNTQLEKQVKELQEKLDEYEKSEPPSGETRKTDTKNGPESADDMIDRLAGMNA